MNKPKPEGKRDSLTIVSLILGIAMAGMNYFLFRDLFMTLFPLGLFWSIALLVRFGPRDYLDTIRQVDERGRYIVREARDYTLGIIGLVLGAGAIYEIFHGQMAGPCVLLSSLMGFVFLVAVTVLHFRT
jgi:cellobiose-specific phosphotransferase system component IIC